MKEDCKKDDSIDPHTGQDYFLWLAKWAWTHSDGCTGVADWFVFCCWAHDFAFQTGSNPYSLYQGKGTVPQSRACSNRKLRWCMQVKSFWGRWFIPSWIRYWGVSLFGRWFYKPNPFRADYYQFTKSPTVPNEPSDNVEEWLASLKDNPDAKPK